MIPAALKSASQYSSSILYLSPTSMAIIVDLISGVRKALLSPAALQEFRRRIVMRLADQNRQSALDPKRISKLEAQIGNLVNAISGGALKSSPDTSARLEAAESELVGLRKQAAPRELARLDRVIHRLDDAFRELVTDLPNAIKRDIDRARATIRRYTGDTIRVESNGKTVRSLSESRRMEMSLLIGAGGAAASQTNVVAGERYPMPLCPGESRSASPTRPPDALAPPITPRP